MCTRVAHIFSTAQAANAVKRQEGRLITLSQIATLPEVSQGCAMKNAIAIATFLLFGTEIGCDSASNDPCGPPPWPNISTLDCSPTLCSTGFRCPESGKLSCVPSGCSWEMSDGDCVALCTADCGPLSTQCVPVVPGLVVAMRFYAGFLTDPAEPFFDHRRGASAVYLYGDGRVIKTASPEPASGPCRAYETYQLPDPEFWEIVSLINETVVEADGVQYQACQPADAGTTGIYARWRGLEIGTSAHPSFASETYCQSPTWTPGPPPADLLELVARVSELGQRDGLPYVEAEGIALMGCASTGGFQPCDLATEANSSILKDDLFEASCSINNSDPTPIILPLSKLGEVQQAFEPHLLDGTLHPTAVALLNGACTIFACDLVLPDENVVR